MSGFFYGRWYLGFYIYTFVYMKILLQKIDPFIGGLVLMLILAWLFPFQEATSNFPLSAVIYWGISGIFLLYGLKLDLRKVVKDISNWRLHLLIQLTTFLLFPLLLLLFYPFFKGGTFEDLWLATFFLAALPSTVSSSVVMVTIAKGNVPSAIFNASISGLIGLIVTPLWMGLFLNQNSGGETSGLAQQLILQILIPVIIGIILNPWLRKYAYEQRNTIAWFDKLVIFLIIYKSFSAAFISDVFNEIVSTTIISLTLLLITLFFIVFFIVKWLSTKLRFNNEDTITAIICGSKKSLVHGSVFVILLFPETTKQSLILLPIMIYHAFQLFYMSYQSIRWGKKVSE